MIKNDDRWCHVPGHVACAHSTNRKFWWYLCKIVFLQPPKICYQAPSNRILYTGTKFHAKTLTSSRASQFPNNSVAA